MFEFFNSETTWLNLVNAGLGVAVLACLLMVGHDVISEIRVRVSGRAHGSIDRHVGFSLESLGITLSDGGEQINELNLDRNHADRDDPPNIIRSDN